MTSFAPTCGALIDAKPKHNTIIAYSLHNSIDVSIGEFEGSALESQAFEQLFISRCCCRWRHSTRLACDGSCSRTCQTHLLHKKTAHQSLLQLLWPPWLLLLVKPLQVSCSDERMSQPVPARLCAHSMLLCVAHAAVQLRMPRNAAIARCSRLMAIGCACCALLASSSSSRTGRMEAAERTSHASKQLTGLLLLQSRPLLAPSVPTAR